LKIGQNQFRFTGGTVDASASSMTLNFPGTELNELLHKSKRDATDIAVAMIPIQSRSKQSAQRPICSTSPSSGYFGPPPFTIVNETANFLFFRASIVFFTDESVLSPSPQTK
jgi:hypothetical protein